MVQPYPTKNVANGVSFCCANTGKAQPSLRHMLKAVETTTGKESICKESCDLSRWEEQGVLMLNTSLTTQVGKAGAHLDIWKGYTEHVLTMLSNLKRRIIFVFMGKVSEKFATFVSDKHNKIIVKHPASAAYSGGVWDCNDLFNAINLKLEEPIVW